ncbi:MAG TPA: SIS domain-containing protein [Spongiibacteraceae bacterium]|jgi:D-sedoheptulose 7-phosphate isomerase|nr:SIS domain-containing protein [Spongiibacteraceae bacterium]HUH39085.1 SIS domain-containing protein [Spongiibacteraceae bacterium]
MDLYQRVVQHFHGGVDDMLQAADLLAAGIIDVATRMANCLLQDGKILTLGEGSAGLLAQHFTNTLMHRYRRERPGLPAVTVASDVSLLTAIATETHYNEVFARQIRALGQPGDLLLIICGSHASGAILQAIQAAHDRELITVAIGPSNCGDLAALLTSDDAILQVPATDPARIIELDLLCLHALSDLIDCQLFGGD